MCLAYLKANHKSSLHTNRGLSRKLNTVMFAIQFRIILFNRKCRIKLSVKFHEFHVQGRCFQVITLRYVGSQVIDSNFLPNYSHLSRNEIYPNLLSPEQQLHNYILLMQLEYLSYNIRKALFRKNFIQIIYEHQLYLAPHCYFKVLNSQFYTKILLAYCNKL